MDYLPNAGAQMESKNIGIIGVWGKYGRWFRHFFETRGCSVIGSDIGTSLSNKDIVDVSEVIVLAVPVELVVEIADELIPHSWPEQLWIDISSVKVPITSVLLRLECESVSIHPMCTPSTDTLRGQTIVVCPIRVHKWVDWVRAFLMETEARLTVSNALRHDDMMAIVQALVHAGALALAGVIRDTKIDIHETLEYTSPFYRIALSLMGRILSQNPQLYAAIQMENTNVPKLLQSLECHIRRLRMIVQAHDVTAFVSDFEASREHFGDQALSDAYQLFEDIVRMGVNAK